MVRFCFFTLFFVVLSNDSFAQNYNLDSVSHINYTALHNTQLNDCWGYVDETGVEYALVGCTDGTSIVSLANPANPVEIFWVPGSNSIWRDLKVYHDIAYVTTEAADGLLIIDLSPLPGNTNLSTSYYFGPVGNQWQRAHNIFIDTLGGWAYVCGANRGNGGAIVLDIHTDPFNPVEVADIDTWYFHDAYAQGNLLYGAHISDGFLSVFDVTDHANPQLLGTHPTTSTFTHNIWVTSDDHYAVTTDEVPNAFLDFFDVSDPAGIVQLDKIQSSPGANVIPHNAFIEFDSIVYTSYYSDGVTIHDMSRPHNVVEIGKYDTDPLQQSSDYHGCWGVYPFFPSGLIIASDITNGLYILHPVVEKPGYYEGLVRDASNLNPLSNVDITITGNPQNDVTTSDGKYAVGTIATGVQQVVFSKVAYYPDTVYIDFQSGIVNWDTIDLVPIVPITYTIHVQDFDTGDPIIDADVRVAAPLLQIDGVSDGFGDAEIDVYYPGLNTLTVGKWGYVTRCIDTVMDQDNSTLVVKLGKGYFDDFSFDFGWTTSSSGATQGLWVRGIPFLSGNNSSPQHDADAECNNYCYLTGNSATFTSTDDDVAGGSVTLKSPVFDLTGYTDPYIYFQRWFFNWHGPLLFDDQLSVSVQSSSQTAVIDLSGDSIYYAQWTPISVRVLDFINLDNSVRLVVSTSDYDDNPNLTEASFDYFMVTEGSVASISDKKIPEWSMAPNPGSGLVTLFGLSIGETIVVYDNLGKTVFEAKVADAVEYLDFSELEQGVYSVLHNGKIRKMVME